RSERFNDDVALITDGFQRADDPSPVGVITAGSSAIASTSVKVPEMLAGFSDGGAEILFLDVHVKAIEVKFHGGRFDGRDQFQSLFARIQKISLEAIQWLDADRDALRFCMAGEELKVLDDQRPFLATLDRSHGVGL